MLIFICHVLLFAAEFIQAAPQKVSPRKGPYRCHANLFWGKPGSPLETITGLALSGSKIPCKGGFYLNEAVWDDPSKNVLTSPLSMH